MIPTNVVDAGYIGKPSFITQWTLYRPHFDALCMVRELGRIKYSAHSWQNDPNASNSSVPDNFNALMRHITLCRMGIHHDPEGFPHIYSIACRIGMLLTTWYRGCIFGTPIRVKVDEFEQVNSLMTSLVDVFPKTHIEQCNPVRYAPYMHITPEEFTSMLKMQKRSAYPESFEIIDKIDACLAKVRDEPAKLLDVILDQMQIHVLMLICTYEYAFKPVPTAKEINTTAKEYLNVINSCDILQYLSAQLHTHAQRDYGKKPNIFTEMHRTPAECAVIIKKFAVAAGKANVTTDVTA